MKIEHWKALLILLYMVYRNNETIPRLSLSLCSLTGTREVTVHVKRIIDAERTSLRYLVFLTVWLSSPSCSSSSTLPKGSGVGYRSISSPSASAHVQQRKETWQLSLPLPKLAFPRYASLERKGRGGKCKKKTMEANANNNFVYLFRERERMYVHFWLLSFYLRCVLVVFLSFFACILSVRSQLFL